LKIIKLKKNKSIKNFKKKIEKKKKKKRRRDGVAPPPWTAWGG
jgi:hypothetical protein